MAAPRLAFLAATPWLAPQCFGPALLGLALVARRMVEVVGFDCPRPLPLHFIEQGGITQPPTPAIARPPMHPHLSGNASRRARQAQQNRREHPVHDRALAAIQERSREVIEGALAALLLTAVALQARLGMVGAPRTNVVALTAGTLEGPIFPAQRMEGGLTRFGVEEVVEMRHHRHG